MFDASRYRPRGTLLKWSPKLLLGGITILLVCTFVLNVAMYNTKTSDDFLGPSHLLRERSLRRDFRALADIGQLRSRLPPSVWTVATGKSDPDVVKIVDALLDSADKAKCMELCGKFLYSTIQRAVQVEGLGDQTFVATGDIDSMWTRDSAVQVGIYYGRMGRDPYLRLIVEGAIRRQAFNIIQDPYANAYSRRWRDPKKLALKDRVIGRGGWVDTRNYELDSGAYFFTQLYDYYVADDLYCPEALLKEPMIFDAVFLMLKTWILEQHHDTMSPYTYFELPRGGKGSELSYTGMTWSGFRPSDDPTKYGYLVPANIHAAAGLERIIELNKRVWNSKDLETRALKLLQDITDGIEKYGIVQVKDVDSDEMVDVYAYEVNGLGDFYVDFDDANVPSLLSIPLLGWSGYNRQIYQNTRKRLLSTKYNKYYYEGRSLKGMGSPHTPYRYVWPMAMAIEGLTEEGSTEEIARALVFQLQQSLKAACGDAMHEGVSSELGCPAFSRSWFEWANALFVVLVETSMGERCDAFGQQAAKKVAAEMNQGGGSHNFYQNRYSNSHKTPSHYQGVEAQVKYF